jgi:predicted dehydrogenase
MRFALWTTTCENTSFSFHASRGHAPSPPGFGVGIIEETGHEANDRDRIRARDDGDGIGGLNAEAFFEKDILKRIGAGLRSIPTKCLSAGMIRDAGSRQAHGYGIRRTRDEIPILAVAQAGWPHCRSAMTMDTPHGQSETALSRRRFLTRASSAVAGAAAITEAPWVHAAAPDGAAAINIGLIGCGGRGTGAALDALGAATRIIYPSSGYHTEDAVQGAAIAKKGIRIAALADLFEDRMARCRRQLEKIGLDVPKALSFTGFDAYRKLLAVEEVNYVILATPPHFRPAHLMAAVEAGKHCFIEKPAAVDVPGVKTVLAAGELAKRKGLGIGAGTQRRHQRNYQETIRRIRDGALGELLYGRCYFNSSEIWVVERQPGWSDLEWQIRNWNYFTWLSGDHIVEQHLHNLDVMNWVFGAHPIRAVSGLGGRQVRTGPHHGYIYDHFAVEYEYPGGVRLFSQCRQINRCDSIVEESVVGANGTSDCQRAIRPTKGDAWSYAGKPPNPYQQEHEDLIASIRAGQPLNEAQAIAESTLTGIIGREAVYSGRAVSWDAALKSETRLGPDKYEFGACPVPEVPMPGKYRFV